MYSEDTPNVTAVGTGFFTEAGRNTRVVLGKLVRVEPLVFVHCGNWLLGSCNQVVILLLAFLSTAFDFVKILSEVRELASGLHNFLLDEEWWLSWCVALRDQSLKTIVDQSLIEKHSRTFEIIATVTSHFLASFELTDVEALHDLVVMQLTKG